MARGLLFFVAGVTMDNSESHTTRKADQLHAFDLHGRGEKGKSFDIVSVGGGPAGFAAAMSARNT